ncbi:L-fuculose 1-phosphate aldolase [Paenisporosarcina sp. OV554]|nr:L-fuculose 1-phosphate aldolase [Paenisporosarcina sp. OV554]
MYMKERKEIVDYCKMLITRGLTKGTGGNISIFDRESGHMIISPSGIQYNDMTAEDVVVCDLQGNVIAGDKKPSSEYPMHAIFYEKRTDINAIVHTHSLNATVIASLRWELPAVSYLVAYAGESVRCAEYASFGTQELATNAFEAMQDRQAVLLANHGLLAGSSNLATAFAIAEEIEFCCEVYVKTKTIGEPIILDEDEMKLMSKKFKTYGQKK